MTITSTGAAEAPPAAAFPGVAGADGPQAAAVPIRAVTIRVLKLFDMPDINVTLINRAYVYPTACKVRMNVRNNVAAQQYKAGHQ
jgi:hypothetical protein